MRHLYLVYITILANLIFCKNAEGSYYHATPGPQHESVEAARERFDRMTVRQMYHVCVADFTPNQQQAFRDLATEYFMSEVIIPGCSSQARRRKYEIMYKKVGEMDKAHTLV